MNIPSMNLPTAPPGLAVGTAVATPPPSPDGGAVASAAPAAPAAPATPPAPAAPSREELQQAARQVQEKLQARASNLVFSLDEDSGQTVVKVIDAQTEEVIRQMPSEEMLALAQSLDEFLEASGGSNPRGLLLKQQV